MDDIYKNCVYNINYDQRLYNEIISYYTWIKESKNSSTSSGPFLNRNAQKIK
jgi:hypothetical protein